MESSSSTAYAFMIMLAGLAVIGYLGRASAEVSPPRGEAVVAAPSAMSVAGYQPQYGLIQTSVIGVAQLDASGTFGRPAAMPVFQVIQLQPAAYAAPRHAALDTAPGMHPQAQAQAEPSIPHGMSVTPPAEPRMAVTLCDIKGVQALTQSAEACITAGGQPAIP